MKSFFRYSVLTAAIILCGFSWSSVHAAPMYVSGDWATFPHSNSQCASGGTTIANYTSDAGTPPSEFQAVSPGPGYYCVSATNYPAVKAIPGSDPGSAAHTDYIWYKNIPKTPIAAGSTQGDAPTVTKSPGPDNGGGNITYTAYTYHKTGGPSGSTGPDAAISATRTAIVKGETSHLSWACTSGANTANIFPAIDGDGTGGSSSVAMSGAADVKPLQDTTYKVSCADYETDHYVGTSATATVFISVSQPTNLQAACFVSPSSAAPGTQMTWKSTVTGGVQPYKYSWTGDGASSGQSTTGSTMTTTYGSSGTKNMNLTVTDSNTTSTQTQYKYLINGGAGYNVQTQCSGTDTGINLEDTQDGGTAEDAREMIPDGLAPTQPDAWADYAAHPENYCVQQLVEQSGGKYSEVACKNFGSGGCYIYIHERLFKGSGTAPVPVVPASGPPQSWLIANPGGQYSHYLQDTLTFQKITNPGTSPSTVTAKCSPATVTGNQPPTAKLICPSVTTVAVNTPVSFQIYGSDPEKGNVRYGLVWDAASTDAFDPPDEWSPTSGYVTSGTHKTVTHSWATAGTYSVAGYAQDVQGADSNITTADNLCAITVGSYPDLTPVSIVPTAVVAGVSNTFTGTIANTGNAASPKFSSTDYVCHDGDTSCQNSILAFTGKQNIFQKIFAFLAPKAQAASAQIITLTGGNGIAAGQQGTQTGTATFATPGNYQQRFCVDLPKDEVNESDEGDNCGNWQLLVVCPSGNTWNGSTCVPPAAAKCTLSADPTNVTGSQQSTLYWTSQNVSSCTPTGFTSGGALNGNIHVGAGNFSMSCTGSNGPASCSTAVTNNGFCTPDKSLDLSAATYNNATQVVGTPNDVSIRVHAAQSATDYNAQLSWKDVSVGDGDVCKITRSDDSTWSYTLPSNGCIRPTGTKNVAVTTQTKFTLTCSTVGSHSVLVNIIPQFQEF